MQQFYFAWVDASQTTFGGQHHVYDESVESFKIEHLEGDIPTLEIEIRNPRVGLLSHGRNTWAWLSWNDGVTVRPIFFGRLVGIPTNMFAEVVTLSFIARAHDFIPQKQALAETLKVAPFWDPIFIDPAKRDDPDTILEGYSALWHIDRTTLQWTVSDILVGEDGEEVFLATDSFYDSVSMKLAQPPLVTIEVEASVHWTQAWRDTINMGSHSIKTYTGDGLLNDWPQPLSGLGGGWSVFTSGAIDVWKVRYAQMATWGWNWTNGEKTHQNGDPLTITGSEAVPVLLTGSTPSTISGVTKSVIQPGLVDPYAVDAAGDPAPINRPAEESISTMYVPLWAINTSLVLRYDAARQRSETVNFFLKSDLQPILTDPLVTEDTELIKIDGSDVGVPIPKFLAWTDVAGQSVSLGDVILPNNPSLPGQDIAQIAVQAGTAGTVEPYFSPFSGETTVDGTVIWASLGVPAPPENAPDWTPDSDVPLGEILLPRVPFYTPYSSLVAPGRIDIPPVGVSVAFRQIVKSGSGYLQCIQNGITSPSGGGAPGLDGTVVWASLPVIPDGSTFYICTRSGKTGEFLPTFHNTVNALTIDGTAVWTSIGPASLPVGGSPGRISARWYFPSDRGQDSIKYLISRARSRLLLRARAVEVSFDCHFDRAIGLSCRKSAVLYDHRIPGGVAVGKITSYRIICTGDRGVMIGQVTMGCAVGRGGHALDSLGEPSYVEEGYVEDDYQVFEGAVDIHPAGDVSYSRPVPGGDDDGLTFPLTKSQVVISEGVKHIGNQAGAIAESIQAAVRENYWESWLTVHFGDNRFTQLEIDRSKLAATAFTVANLLKYAPVYYEAELKPVDNGPFAAEYTLQLSNMSVPMGINLESESTP